MDTQKMQYLVKIAELESITEAARQLYVSQPALSQVIAYMEQKYELKIFCRKDRKLQLTSEGAVLLEAIQAELRIEENMKRRLSDIKSESVGQLSVGLSPGRAAQFLPEILPDFTEQHPGITLNISTDLNHGLENLVLEGNVELAFVMDIAVIPPSKREMLVYEPLFPYHALLSVPPGHELALEAKGVFDWNQRPPVSLLRVKEEPFILLKFIERNAHYTKKIFLDYGFEPKVKLIMTGENIIVKLVQEGIGFAVVQEHTALTYGSGIFYRLDRENAVPKLCLIYRRDAYLSKPGRTFIKLVKERTRAGVWQKAGHGSS